MVKKLKKKLFSKTQIDVFLALLSAFLLASLTYGANLAVYISIIPLLLIIYRNDFKTSVAFCAMVGFLSSLFAFDWIYDYKPYLYLIVIILLTFFFTFFGALTHILYRKAKHLSLFIAPSVWLWLMLITDLTRYGSYVFEFSMYNPLMAPLIWFIGGRGITFVVIALNSAAAELIIRRSKKNLLATTVILTIIVLCYSYSSVAKPSGDPFKVTLVQGNFDETWTWRQDHVKEIFETYKGLSIDKTDQDLIIWPEYAIVTDVKYNPLLFRELQSIARKTGSYFITGSMIHEEKTGLYYDVALLFNPEGNLVDTYKSVYPAFYNNNTIKGEEGIKLFQIQGKKAGIMVCAEETDSKTASSQSKRGAQFLISISNNQGFGRGIHLSSLYSRLRAAENYKYLARTTNTGVTQIVDQYGRIQKTDENKRKILIGQILLSGRKTPYTLYGNIPLYILMVLLLPVWCCKKGRNK